MPGTLDHVIVHCRDQRAAASFLTGLMGSPEPVHWGPFAQVTTANGVGIDFLDSVVDADRINISHIALLVSDEEFDAVMGRITERAVPYWADPEQKLTGEINHDFGGRGVYVRDPGGTVSIEFMTAPYGEFPDS